MKLLAPQALLLLLALPLLAAAYMRRQAKPALGLPGVERRAPRAWQRHLPAALYGLAAALAVLAAARPSALITLPSQQRTIILSIDVSLSMRASDVKPTRIDAAQAAARDFVREPPADVKIGIVSFAGTAAVCSSRHTTATTWWRRSTDCSSTAIRRSAAASSSPSPRSSPTRASTSSLPGLPRAGRARASRRRNGSRCRPDPTRTRRSFS